jgi:hypothetical protein
MIKDIIDYLNGRLGSLNYFSKNYSLCELQTFEGSKKMPVIYEGAKWTPVDLLGLGTTYWRKVSDVSFEEVDTMVSGRVLYESRFTLVLVAFTTRSEFPGDNNFSPDRLATGLIKTCTITGGDLMRSIGARKLSVRPSGYATNPEGIKESEFVGVDFSRFKDKDLAVAITFDVVITSQNICLEEPCGVSFPEKTTI